MNNTEFIIKRNQFKKQPHERRNLATIKWHYFKSIYKLLITTRPKSNFWPPPSPSMYCKTKLFLVNFQVFLLSLLCKENMSQEEFGDKSQ